MTYLFLSFFWVGIFIIKFKPAELKDRAKALYSKASEESKSLKISVAISKFKNKRLKEKQMNELSACLSYIKNVAVLGKNQSISTLTLLDGLMDITVLLQPAFRKMARLLSVNEKTSASLVLQEFMGSGMAADIGGFLAAWEDIAPTDMVQTIEAYQSAIREERTTMLKAREELISDLVYFPAVVNSMLVLLNFIYVAYFAPQREALSILF